MPGKWRRCGECGRVLPWGPACLCGEKYMDFETYQLMLDDLGELVTACHLPLGEMMNQSPRDVLRDCIARVKEYREALSEVAMLYCGDGGPTIYHTAEEMITFAEKALHMGRPGAETPAKEIRALVWSGE